jgi:hypothetical protein
MTLQIPRTALFAQNSKNIDDGVDSVFKHVDQVFSSDEKEDDYE